MEKWFKNKYPLAALGKNLGKSQISSIYENIGKITAKYKEANSPSTKPGTCQSWKTSDNPLLSTWRNNSMADAFK